MDCQCITLIHINRQDIVPGQCLMLSTEEGVRTIMEKKSQQQQDDVRDRYSKCKSHTGVTGPTELVCYKGDINPSANRSSWSSRRGKDLV